MEKMIKNIPIIPIRLIKYPIVRERVFLKLPIPPHLYQVFSIEFKAYWKEWEEN